MVSISDLHFGNPRIDASELYRKLRTYFYPHLAKSHLITLNGDIYDQLLTVNSKAYHFVTQFISDLFRISETYGCQIRILHGTYSHDRDQLSILAALATDNTRYRIVNKIESEVISDFRCESGEIPGLSLTVGYLPDNLPYRDVTPVVAQLANTLTVIGKDKLNLLIGHGSFAHTLPKNIPLPPLTYTEETFSELVDGIVVMGHIHIHSHKNNIFYCGSFERMSHNEEEKKGFYSFTYTDKWSNKFIPNPEATPFITHTFTEPDAAKLTRKYLDLVKTAIGDRRGYVRIIHASPEMRTMLHAVTTRHVPNVILQTKAPKDVEQKILKVSDIALDVCDEVKPTKENLGNLVYQYLSENNALRGFTQDAIIAAVSEIVKH